MITDELIQQVRRKLNITWEDSETSARVNDIMTSAIPDLIHRLGITDPDFDFAVAGAENKLFLNLCLYEFNHVGNEFWNNYADDIATVRAKYEVEHYVESEAAASE